MAGYVTDTPYADTFFRELSPAWLNYVAALNGVAPQPLESPFTYLELGCGFGTSAVINAAAYPQVRVHACDFNEAHIDAGRRYAAALGVENIVFHADPFGALLTRDLPRFHFIVMHGVYSWVDGQTRAVLRQLVARLLAPGGLVYVSYNALPGWSHELPLRKLLVELAETTAGSAAERSEEAAAVLETISAGGFRYFVANPGAKSAVEAYRRGDGHYLAHEFLNAAWEPFYGVDVADDFATIGLELVGSATLASNHLPLIVEARAAEAISRLPTQRQQQLAIDFAVNQRFRRDVFARREAAPDGGHLEAVPIGSPGDASDIGPTARVPRGDIRFQEPFVRDVRAVMAGGARRFGEAVAALGRDGQDKTAIARNLLYLIAGGALAPFARSFRPPYQPTRIASTIIERALRDASQREGRRAVPSPVFGNGVEFDAAEARAVLDWGSDRPVPDGFVERRLPVLAHLGLVG